MSEYIHVGCLIISTLIDNSQRKKSANARHEEEQTHEYDLSLFSKVFTGKHAPAAAITTNKHVKLFIELLYT